MTTECYELSKALKRHTSVKTDDGWVIEQKGDRNNPRCQRITATKDEKEICLNHYWGSEGIDRILMKARNDDLPYPIHSI